MEIKRFCLIYQQKWPNTFPEDPNFPIWPIYFNHASLQGRARGWPSLHPSLCCKDSGFLSAWVKYGTLWVQLTICFHRGQNTHLCLTFIKINISVSCQWLSQNSKLGLKLQQWQIVLRVFSASKHNLIPVSLVSGPAQKILLKLWMRFNSLEQSSSQFWLGWSPKMSVDVNIASRSFNKILKY